VDRRAAAGIVSPRMRIRDRIERVVLLNREDGLVVNARWA
jgi:hypothetical protein